MSKVRILILGTDCPKCKQAYANAERAVERYAGTACLEKVDDLEEIMKYGVMMVPGVVINGRVVSVGQSPSVEQFSKWIEETESTET